MGSRPEASLPPVPSQNRSYPTPQTGDLRIDFARTPRCDPGQFGTAHAQLRTPEIPDSIWRVRAPHVPYWPPQLSRTGVGLT